MLTKTLSIWFYVSFVLRLSRGRVLCASLTGSWSSVFLLILLVVSRLLHLFLVFGLSSLLLSLQVRLRRIPGVDPMTELLLQANWFALLRIFCTLPLRVLIRCQFFEFNDGHRSLQELKD